MPVAIIDGARASDGSLSGIAKGAAIGGIEYAAPGVAEGNSTCTKVAGVARVGAGGALATIGGAAGAVLGNVPGAILGVVGGAWAGDKFGDGVEALCKMATSSMSSDSLAMTKYTPAAQSGVSNKVPAPAVASHVTQASKGA